MTQHELLMLVAAPLVAHEGADAVQGRYGRLGDGVAVLFVFATAVHTSLPGRSSPSRPSRGLPRTWRSPHG